MALAFIIAFLSPLSLWELIHKWCRLSFFRGDGGPVSFRGCEGGMI